MIDFDYMLYFIMAAVPFFVVSLAICAIWKKPDDAASKAGKLRKWFLRISLAGSILTAISMIVCPLLGLVGMIYGVPISAVVLLILFLIRFIQVRIMRKKGSDEVRKVDGKALLMLLILSAAFVVVMIAVLVCILFLPAGAIAYM